MLIKKRYLKGKIFFPINNDFNKKLSSEFASEDSFNHLY